MSHGGKPHLYHPDDLVQHVSVGMPGSLLRRLNEETARRQVSRSQLVTEAVAKHLKVKLAKGTT